MWKEKPTGSNSPVQQTGVVHPPNGSQPVPTKLLNTYKRLWVVTIDVER